MKTILMAAAAATALFAASAASAQTPANAGFYVGAGYSWTDVETPFGDAEGDGFTFDGAVAFPLGQASPLGMQIDAGISSAEDTEVLSGTAHLFTRNDAFALGGFAGVVNVDDTNAWVFGGEGQSYLPNVTLAGSLGWGQIDDIDADLWGANGEARFFLNDNLRLDAGIGWLNIDTGFGDADAFSFGVGGEFQPAAMPVSVFASWVRSDQDDFEITSDTLSIGVRFNFHQSLRQRDRSGPSFNRLGGFGSALGSM